MDGSRCGADGGDHLHVGTYVTDLMMIAGTAVTRLTAASSPPQVRRRRQVVIGGVDGVLDRRGRLRDVLTLSGAGLARGRRR